MSTFIHQIKCLMLENDSLSLHEITDAENIFDNETIEYTSDHAYSTEDLIGLLEDAVNMDRPAYAHLRCSYAEFPLIQTDSMVLAF